MPEAEWGFEEALRADVVRFAEAQGYRIQRIVFEEPEDLSPLVADLHRWWYRQRNLQANRLLVESFVLHEPYWALRTGSAPFWMKFNMEPSFEAVNRYLDTADPYDYINMMLFSHGVDCVGSVSIAEWRSVLERATKAGAFTGVDEQEYPMDFASFTRYHTEVQKIPSRYPIPGPLALSELGRFLEESGHRYAVDWVEHEALATV